jgi:hypothetical protein
MYHDNYDYIPFHAHETSIPYTVPANYSNPSTQNLSANDIRAARESHLMVNKLNLKARFPPIFEVYLILESWVGMLLIRTY